MARLLLTLVLVGARGVVQAHAPSSTSSFTVAGDGSTAVVSTATGTASLSVTAPASFADTILLGSTSTPSGSGFKLLDVGALC